MPAALVPFPEPQRTFHSAARSEKARTVRFAHPAETVIADLLDSHGIAWQYEPTTFPLESTPDGRPLQSFTPDFYLPACDTYIEMTTMRQSLVTRKNRKFRLLRERYPDLNVRLLYRRDVELIDRHYRAKPVALAAGHGSILLSEETIHRRLDETAAMLTDQRSTSPVAVVALGSGSARLATELAERIEQTSPGGVRQVLMEVARTSGSITFGLSDRIDPRSRVVLAVDVVGTGLTLFNAMRWLSDRNIEVQATVALADRRSARLVDVPIFAALVAAPSTWLTGFGLSNDPAPGLYLLDGVNSPG